MSDYLSELSTAKKAANEAANIIRKFQSSNSFSIDFKGKNDLVTDADLQAEEKILSIIRNNFPDDHILAEESVEKLALPEKRTWIVDPIDGTTNFAHGFPVYCVSIGLWENKQPQMGLVLEVARDECFTALSGKGAFLDGHPISVSTVDEPRHALIGTGFPYNDFSMVDNYLHFFRMLMENTQGVRRPGAASYDLCCVACGRFDGFYEYSLNPWDVGAAALIVEEARGEISDWQGDDDWLLGERIIAGNPQIHSFLLEQVGNHFDAEELSGINSFNS